MYLQGNLCSLEGKGSTFSNRQVSPLTTLHPKTESCQWEDAASSLFCKDRNDNLSMWECSSHCLYKDTKCTTGDKNLATKKCTRLGVKRGQISKPWSSDMFKTIVETFTMQACLALILQPTENELETLVYMPTYCYRTLVTYWEASERRGTNSCSRSLQAKCFIIRECLEFIVWGKQ